ncbi:MAG TPA: TerB family tellurite resistance protein [Gammaproteobacteria bacterium]|nr:TerB family tellurite resistance protein [Gammaproteobacteria bacterium]
MTTTSHIKTEDILENREAFRVKIGAKKGVFDKWGIPIAGGIGAGSLVLTMAAYVALVANTGWFTPILITLGIVAPPTLPIVNAILVGLLAGGVIKGWRIYSTWNTEQIKKSFSSPLSRLCYDASHWLFIPAVGMALSDGMFQKKERDKIKELMKGWGYRDAYILKFLREIRRDLGFNGVNIAIPALGKKIRSFEKEYKNDISFKKIKTQIIDIATAVMEADGWVTIEEEDFLKRLEKL